MVMKFLSFRIFVVFLLGIFFIGCDVAMKTANNSPSTQPKNYEKKDGPESTSPWKSHNKRNKKAYSSRRRYKDKLRLPTGNSKKKSVTTNLDYNEKGLNKSTERSFTDPNPDRSWNIGAGIGPSNTLSDTKSRNGGGNPLFFDIKHYETRLSYSVFGRYKFNKMFTASAWFTLSNFIGSDATYKGVNRGFSFINRAYEFSVRPEYNFPYMLLGTNSDGYFTTFDYYVFAGLGGFYHSPTFTDASNNETEEIAKTDGYKNIQFAIPFGAGCYFSFPSRFKIGFDIGVRKTFFDHLDGFTTTKSKASDYFISGAINIQYVIKVDKRFKENNNYLNPKLNRRKEKAPERRKSIFFK